jgi:hypothetical protein
MYMKIRRPRIAKVAANFIAPYASYPLTDIIFHLRNTLPEPFDYANHAGNVMAGAAFGNLFGNLAAAAYVDLVPEDRQTAGRMRLAAAALATTVALAANAVVETRIGLSLTPESFAAFAGTPDAIDFAYGVGAAAITGAIAPTKANQ